MFEKEKINNENQILNKDDEKLIEKVDEYNINQLLMNLFKRLLMKCETQQNPNNNDNSALLQILVEKIKSN